MTGDITLNIPICPTDAGVGGVQIAYGTGPVPNSNWTGCSAVKTFSLGTEE